MASIKKLSKELQQSMDDLGRILNAAFEAFLSEFMQPQEIPIPIETQDQTRHR